MNRASPHMEQPHSGQSPSGTSGQPPASACNCSNGLSPPHPVQYLVTCVILATSSVWYLQRMKIGVGADSDMTDGRFVGCPAACLEGRPALGYEAIPTCSDVRRSQT